MQASDGKSTLKYRGGRHWGFYRYRQIQQETSGEYVPRRIKIISTGHG